MDGWTLGLLRVYWAYYLSGCLTWGLTKEEMIVLADFYSLLSRCITAIAIASKEAGFSEKKAPDGKKKDD